MLTYLLMLVVQIAVLVAIAYGLHWHFRRRPKVQYFVWLAAILSIGLAIPLQSQVPSVEVQVPIAAKKVSQTEPPRAASPVQPDHFALPKMAIESKVPDNIRAIQRKRVESAVNPAGPVALPKLKTTRLTVWNWLVIAYFAIVALLVLRLLTGVWSLHRLAHSASNTSCSVDVVNTIANQACPQRNVRVLISEQVRVPMAFGILRPTVMLPESFTTWSKETQQAVLLHEFGHVQRFDAFWDFVARLIAVAYWFHPAVYFSIRRLCETRERATDRFVLEHGVSPTVYANQLLEVAANASRLPQPAIYMSCHGDIKNRIGLILESAVAPEKKSWSMKIALLVGFLILASTSLSVSFATISNQDETETQASKDEPAKKKDGPTKPEDVTGKTFFERVQQIKPTKSKSAGKRISISGRVIDPNGNPVPDAVVVFRNASSMFSPSDDAINDVMAKTTSRRDGTYSFDDLVNPVEPRGGPACELFCVSETMVGFGDFQCYGDSVGAFENVNIRLVDTVSVKGQIVDAEGNPVPGTRVGLNYISKSVIAKKDGGVEVKPVPGRLSHRRSNSGYMQRQFGDRMINPRSITDEQGNFELPGFPSGFVAGLILDHPEFALEFEAMRSTKDHPKYITNYDNSRTEINDNGSTIEMKKGIELSGTVTDEDGNPVEGTNVSTTWRSTSTDANGRFAIRAIERDADPRLDFFVGNSFQRIFRIEQSKLRDGSAKFRFVKPGTIKAKVLSAHSGKPISGFQVTFDSDGDGMGRVGQTDINGTFELLVESGKMKMTLGSNPALVIEQAHGEGWEKPKVGGPHKLGEVGIGVLEVKPDETKEITIQIPVRDAIRAKVLGLDGNPVEGALVGYQTMSGGTVGFSKTDANGMAALDPPFRPIETPTLVARFEKEGSVLFAELDVKEKLETEVAELQLRPSITLSGVVSVQSQPVSGAKISVRRPNGSKAAYEVAAAVTNKIGFYSVQVSRGSVKGRLPNYRIALASEKIPNEKISLGVNKARLADGQLKADIDLIRGLGKIAGVVVDSAGDPVANSSIEVQHLMTRHPERTELQPNQLFESMSRTTDEHGRFQIDGLPEGFEAIVVAIPQSTLQGASMISVGNLSAKILVTDVGEESKFDSPYRFDFPQR